MRSAPCTVHAPIPLTSVSRVIDKTGKRLPGLIADVDLVVEGGPHAIPWTHADQVNTALLRFLGHPAA
jgi:hypothetical protein